MPTIASNVDKMEFLDLFIHHMIPQQEGISVEVQLPAILSEQV